MKCTSIVIAILLAVPSLGRGEDSPASAGEPSVRPQFVVAPGGDDANPGTEQRPLATLKRAKEAVRRRIAAGLTSDVTVLIRGGTYQLTEPLVFGPEDSGTENCAVTYAAWPGETVVLSGGRKISGWRPGEGKIWTARVPGVEEGKSYFRGLFVNGRRAVRARTPNEDDESAYWPLKAAELSQDLKRYTLTLASGLLKSWQNASDVEVLMAGNWAVNRKRVQTIDAKAGVVVLAPPHPPVPPWNRPGPGRWCYFENAREMLDRPGEWYLDRQTGLLSYWPLPGEDMTRAEVVAPLLSRLVEVTGTPDRPVRNLHFKGISFQYTDWPLPAGGYFGVQACHYVTAGESRERWHRIPAAIRFDYAEGSSVEDGAIAHLGGGGIELVSSCRDNLIQGNHIFDVSGNGVMLGGPKTEAEVPKNNRVSNNHVHACGVEYHGAVGIWVGFTEGSVISHNLVHDLPYTGISVGWQWNPEPSPCKRNVIEYNHIYNVMNRLCDGGGIYTLGLQPGTTIRGNHIHDVHRSRFAQGAPNNGMFIDQGSKGYLFEGNVIYSTHAELVRFNQCSREWHTWRDNHFGEPAEVKESGKEIILKAGLQPPYRRRLAPGQ